MKILTWQNPGQLFVAQELINKVKLQCCGIKEKHDFDICLLGCGAYGFPLAAHVKRLGKKAVHIGGALQLLFGIKGRRWDREFSSIYNDAWVRPEENEKPRNANSVEGGCYW